MWKAKISYVDYFSNRTTRTYNINPTGIGTNDGAGYTNALAMANTLVTQAGAVSLANTYLDSVFWETENTYLPASSVCAVTNVLSLSFDLNGKIQKGRATIPCPDHAVVLDSNRQVDLVAVRASDLVQSFLDASLVISDGDEATWMRDANIISVRGKIETE